VFDQQSIILSEMKVRIARLLKLELVSRIETPMAVLVGKCDAWLHLLGGQAFQNPVVSGGLDLEVVHENSARLREFMKGICPAVVANAESISQRVFYFPVSSFGHSPVKVGPGDYVPDPRALKPFMVEIPVLWLLSQIAPDLVPARSG
jgi:hypothetical protein